METLQSAISMMTKGCYMACIDLKDAYYSVPIHEDFKKYLKFSWENNLYEFTCLPNGLACAPRLFTKLLKPVLSTLRLSGFLSVAYIDDIYLQGDTEQSCKTNVETTLIMLRKLGFVVHPKKSNFNPCQEIKFLGFILNSERMTVSPSPNKAASIAECIKSLLAKTKPTIRNLAEVIGKIVAVFPGCQYGPLHYRKLEQQKIEALRAAKGDYDSLITISRETKVELLWWIDNIHKVSKPVLKTNPDTTLSSDASLSGWGAAYNGQSTGGRWSHDEATHHINVLELKAAYFALQTFFSKSENMHIRILIDNTTAVAYINNMGGSHSESCNDVANCIWSWGLQRNLWLSAAHLPGSQNIEADRASRIFDDNTEWKLHSDIFQMVTEKFFMPTIDLFASRINYQVSPYVAWHPDPGAQAIDAFTIDWGTEQFYAFPPFSLLGKVIQKIQNDKAHGILVVPYWPTQPWYPQMTKLLVTEPILLPKKKDTLTLPYNRNRVHPLHPKLQLLACHLSVTP